jgi:hypothetical protein
MGEEVAYSVDLFIDYFRRLVASDTEEAGWTELKVTDWNGKKKENKEWLEETGAKAEWRCASGDGPHDQARITFVVDTDLEIILHHINGIKSSHAQTVGTFVYVLDKGEDWRQVYRAIKLPWPLRQRDMVYTEHVKREPGGGEAALRIAAVIKNNKV